MITKIYSVYIMSNMSLMLYTGMTNNLLERIEQHRNKASSASFTAKYNINKLVYFEVFQTPMEAIFREKQIKNMNRLEKLALITKVNPKFSDLSLSLKNDDP